MSEDTEQPIFHDALFHRKRKKGKWDVVDAPELGAASIADTHAHLQLMNDPVGSLARSAVYHVNFIELITDIAEDKLVLFDRLDEWMDEAYHLLFTWVYDFIDHVELPHVRIACGVHPHNARLYTPAMEDQLITLLHNERVSAIGEVGLDYHYDYSPREVQRDVFRRQIQLASELNVPILLHVREAHDDAFRILEEEGFPTSGVLLHCFNLDSAELARWIDKDCYVAFGGPLTFKHSDEVREAATHVPLDRLLTETDAPFMTPEPLRGTTCGSEHVIWTAAKLCEVRGALTEDARDTFLEQIYQNALGLLDRAPLRS